MASKESDGTGSEKVYGSTIWSNGAADDSVDLDENGHIPGFTPLSAADVASKGLVAQPREGAPISSAITSYGEDGSINVNVHSRPRVLMELAEPARAAEEVRFRPIACQKGSGKHSGHATMMLTVRGESDLVSHPYALCQHHVQELQQKFPHDTNYVLTPITPNHLPKLHDQMLARTRSGILSMESSLRTGGYEISIPADAETPPEQVQLPKADLLYGRKTESFGVRGPSLDTHLDIAKGRRTEEEQESILSDRLEALRSGEDQTVEDPLEEVKPRGTAKTRWSFKPTNPEGLYRNYSENSLLLPPGAKGGRKPSTRVRNKREHAGTNTPNTTWESVGYGSEQDLIEALPAHLQSNPMMTGTIRPLTPVERFAESRSDEEDVFKRQLDFEEASARKLRAIQAAKSMTREERAHLEREIRSRKAIEFDSGLGETDDSK